MSRAAMPPQGNPLRTRCGICGLPKGQRRVGDERLWLCPACDQKPARGLKRRWWRKPPLK